MAKKEEKDKVRFVKVFTPMVLNRRVRTAFISGKYSTLELAQSAPEKGRIMTPLEAYWFIIK